MRWLLAVVVMCNAIYFFWGAYLKSPAAEDTGANVAAKTYSQSQRLTLLNEQPGDPRPQDVPEPERAAAEQAPAMCWQIGPFVEEVSARQIAARLQALDITMTVVAVEIPGDPDYWVHIPPFSSRKEALSRLRELQASKIDSFLIGDGELENGISLGFFTTKSRAEKVLQQRLAQGYEAKIKIVPRASSELWGIIGAEDFSAFSDALWQKVAAGSKGLERRKNYCDKIASPDNFA